MIMPFIRLVSIYVIVIVAVVAIFQRDKIMELTSATFGWPQSEQAGAEAEADAPETAPAVEVTATTEPVAVDAAPEGAAEVADVAENTDVIQQPTPTPTAVEIADADGDDTQSRLNEARQSFWQGDMVGATDLYVALARDVPSNPDVNGELGNVLYAQARYGEAADAYLVTGKLLVSNGNRAQVMPLVAVLQSIDPEKAATLQALMVN